MFTISIDKIPLGESAVVLDLKHNGDMRRRMLEIGFTRGTMVKCIGESPFGDPRAYFVKGAVFAVRNKDAGGIIVRPCV